MTIVIVAHYKEDTCWTLQLKVPFLILTKDEYMPNVGRETGTYLKYIIENYDTLRGLYVFCQGNPFDHCPNFVWEANQPMKNILYKDFGEQQYFCYFDGHPQHSGLELTKVWDELSLGEKPDKLMFTAGAQFAVDADLIKRRPREFYEKALKLCLTQQQGPWEFERLWRYIFNE